MKQIQLTDNIQDAMSQRETLKDKKADELRLIGQHEVDSAEWRMRMADVDLLSREISRIEEAICHELAKQVTPERTAEFWT